MARGLANKFTLRFAEGVLAAVGPLIPAAWFVPEQQEAQLRTLGRPVPPPVEGHILLDTGASSTCISKAAAEKLGLRAISKVKGFGAGGLHTNDMVVARLGIAIEDERRRLVTQLFWNGRCQAIPEMEKHLQGILLNNEPVSLIGLLGRDILSLASFVYNGKKGTLEMTFDPTWIRSLQQPK
jgi:hypothetical protein